MRKNYPTDISEAEWKIIEPMFSSHRSRHSKKEILNAIFYILRAGCPWRLLPHDFPPWQTVYSHFRDWQNLGLWEKMNEILRRLWRVKSGKKEDPSGAIIDSQSVKTTEKGGSKDMMEQKKSKAENGISWLIHKEFCS
jgi:putative transposase